MKDKILFWVIITSLFFSLCCGPGENEPPEAPSDVDLSSIKPSVPFKGRIVFYSDPDGDEELYLLTKKGLEKLTDNTWNDECPKWSPDGKKIAFAANPQGKYEIFIMDLESRDITQITTKLNNPIGYAGHAWSPDGKKIAYTVERSKGIFKRNWIEEIDLRTKKTKKLLPEFSAHHGIPDYSPTEPLLSFTGKRTRGWDAAMHDFRTNESFFLVEGGKSCRGHFSPDGKKLAYVSTENNKADIWLMNPDGSSKKRLTFMDETHEYFPAWSPDGKFIVFSSVADYGSRLAGNWALYVVEVKTGEVSLLLDTPGGDLFPHWTK